MCSALLRVIIICFFLGEGSTISSSVNKKAAINTLSIYTRVIRFPVICNSNGERWDEITHGFYRNTSAY